MHRLRGSQITVKTKLRCCYVLRVFSRSVRTGSCCVYGLKLLPKHSEIQWKAGIASAGHQFCIRFVLLIARNLIIAVYIVKLHTLLSPMHQMFTNYAPLVEVFFILI